MLTLTRQHIVNGGHLNCHAVSINLKIIDTHQFGRLLNLKKISRMCGAELTMPREKKWTISISNRILVKWIYKNVPLFKEDINLYSAMQGLWQGRVSIISSFMFLISFSQTIKNWQDRVKHAPPGCQVIILSKAKHLENRRTGTPALIHCTCPIQDKVKKRRLEPVQLVPRPLSCA